MGRSATFVTFRPAASSWLLARWLPMLQHLPHWLGSALANVRAGHERLTIVQLDLSRTVELRLTSPAFASGARLPERFTADGEGVSPPLNWNEPPPGTESLLLLVEDADAPTPQPLVHAILAGIDPAASSLAEGAIVADGDGGPDGDSGRNSFLREGWLPPDLPTGHGSHDYVFQLFALGPGEPLDTNPGRSDVVEALKSRPVLAAGTLVGTYSRGEPAAAGPIGTGAAAPA